MTATKKIPYWVSPSDLKAISTALNKEKLRNHPVAEGVQDEIGVAHARADSSSISTSSLALVLGMLKDSLPLHLSEEEVKFLLEIETIPDHVKKRLL